MSNRHRSLALGTLLALMTLFAAREAPAARQASVQGRLVSLSPAARTLTIQRDNGSHVLLRANSASVLLRNGARVGLPGLALRDGAVVRFNPATLGIVRLEARGPAMATTRGTFAGLDSVQQVVRLATAGGERRFGLGPGTLVVRNGLPARAADLTVRDSLVVHTRVDAAATPQALDIAADGPEKAEVEGKITVVAGAKVTIAPAHGQAVEVRVDDHTEIVLEKHDVKTAGTLADLAVGQLAEAEYDPATRVAFTIEVELGGDDEEAGDDPAEVEGEVTAVDASAHTLTIAPARGAPVTLSVDAKTSLTREGAVATLSDVRVGDRAEAEYDPDSLVASKVEVEADDDEQEEEDDGEQEEEDDAEVEGEVTAISAASITIDPERGAAITLALTGTTEILVDDKPATAAAIQIGDEAEATYDAKTLVASKVEVESEEEDD